MKLHDWLLERAKNARGLATGLDGSDRDGWLEDADYFERAAQAVAHIDAAHARMARSIEQWRACDPHAMATQQSAAAIEFAFADAKHDILCLHRTHGAPSGT